MFRLAPFVLCTLFALGTLPAYASDPAPMLPDWERLTPAQRDVLIAPTRERWNSRPADRARMFRHAERWRAMTPEQRKRARHGVDRFQGMTPEQRAEARAMFSHMRGLDPDQRRALRERLQAMTPEQRRAWLQAHPRPSHAPAHPGPPHEAPRREADAQGN